MKNITELEQKEMVKGFKARFLHTHSITLAWWEVEQGALLPQHSHIHEQTTQVLEGKFELTVEGKVYVCKPGAVVVIPSNTVHSGVALTDCKILDIFSPVREDYK